MNHAKSDTNAKLRKVRGGGGWDVVGCGIGGSRGVTLTLV